MAVKKLDLRVPCSPPSAPSSKTGTVSSDVLQVRWGNKTYSVSVFKKNPNSGEEEPVTLSDQEKVILITRLEKILIYMDYSHFSRMDVTSLNFCWKANPSSSSYGFANVTYTRRGLAPEVFSFSNEWRALCETPFSEVGDFFSERYAVLKI
jgi:hypothetical protein